METIELTDFGFDGIQFTFYGEVVTRRAEGDRLLFLFGEEHEVPAIIKPNVLNALELARLGVIACVGVEEYPFVWEGRTDADVERELERNLARHGDEAGIITALGPLYFGQTVKLLCPTMPVRCVDDPKLYEAAEKLDEKYRGRIERRAREIFARMTEGMSPTAQERMRLDTESQEQARVEIKKEYGEEAVHIQRDEAFIRNMMTLWGKNGFKRAAILNGGGKHIERITAKLPAEVRYIWIVQT